MNIIQKLVNKYPDKFENYNDPEILFSKNVAKLFATLGGEDGKIYIDPYCDEYRRRCKVVHILIDDDRAQLSFPVSSKNSIRVDDDDFKEFERIALEYYEKTTIILKELIKKERINKIKEM